MSSRAAKGPTRPAALPPPPPPPPAFQNGGLRHKSLHEEVALSVAELQETSDSRLLSYLMQVYELVRGCSLTVASPRLRSSPFTDAYLAELLTPRLLFSTIPDVSQLVGCLICDAVRLHHEERHRRGCDSMLGVPAVGKNRESDERSTPSFHESSPLTDLHISAGVEMAGASALPFPEARCAEVLRCICGCFELLLERPINAAATTAAESITTLPLRPARLPLQRVAYLVERAAAAHIFSCLLPHCEVQIAEVQLGLQSVFEAVRCASAVPSPKFTSALGSRERSGGEGATASPATCGEMAEIILDIVRCTKVVTPSQLLPLLGELASSSTALRLASSSFVSSSSSSSHLSTTAVRTAGSLARPLHRSGRHNGAGAIAARVLLEEMEALQPTIAMWATAAFDDGLAVFAAEEIPFLDRDDVQRVEGYKLEAGTLEGEGEEEAYKEEVEAMGAAPQQGHAEWGEQSARGGEGKILSSRRTGSFGIEEAKEGPSCDKRRGLHAMARILEVMVALTELHVDLVSQLLPALASHLEHVSPEVRLLLLRAYGAAFGANETCLTAYRSTFAGPVLSRFLDHKPNIRMEALRLSAMLLRRACDTISASGDDDDLDPAYTPGCAPISTGAVAFNQSSLLSLQQELWRSFEPCWERLLTDPNVLVRKQAVHSVTEAALAVSGILLPASPRDCVAQTTTCRDHQGSRAPAHPSHPSAFLARTLGLRCRDKNRRVRCAAVEGLTTLYTTYRLAWIPNAVLDAPRVDTSHLGGTPLSSTVVNGALLMEEAVLEGLLRLPVSAMASPRTATASSLAGWVAPASGTSTPWPPPRSREGLDFAGRATGQEGLRVGRRRSSLEQGESEEEEVRAEGGFGDTETFAEGDALLGFGKETPTTTPAAVKPISAAAAYVEALVQLCRHVDANHFTQLRRVAEKKPRLRLAIVKLFEFHAAVKASEGDVKTPEGQQRIHAIHRLLSFLQETTGARKGEWDALFRAKDGAVRRALVHACSPAHKDWAEVRDTLLHNLHGRIGAGEYTFVKQTLLPQMLLATKPAHLTELLERLRRSVYVSTRGEVVTDDEEAAAALRAVLLLMVGSPSYGALSLETLIDVLQAVAKLSTSSPPCWCALLLQILQLWAVDARERPMQSTGSSPPLSPARRDTLVGVLHAIAVASLPMQQVAPRGAAVALKGRHRVAQASGTPASLTSYKHLPKQATRALVELLDVPGFHEAGVAALRELVSELTYGLSHGRALTNDIKTLAWLASLRALVCGGARGGNSNASPIVNTLLRPSEGVPSTEETTAPLPALLPHLSSLLHAAIADTSDPIEQAKLPPHGAGPGAATAASAGVVTLGAGEHGEVSVVPSDACATAAIAHSPLQSVVSLAAAIADSAAKAMVALSLQCPLPPQSGGTSVATRAAAVSYTTDALLRGYKGAVTRASGRFGAASIGSCQRRLSMEKPLLKLLLTPTPDIRKELAVAVVVSAEEDIYVRHAVQLKLATHLQHRTCDMRIAALLLLTAMSEETKSSYQRLRSLVEAVGDHLRAKQVSQGTSLSSPAALYCYLEYTIPFLVFFLAHHPYYTSEERENHFIGFQRVWHLLIGELFRHGTQCAGFVVELLSTIKQRDDVLAPSDDTTRVICDLGSRVLLECLGQRESRVEDLRRYPGAILLPSFFVRTSRADPQKLLHTVFLDENVRIAPSAPFRPPISGGSAGVAGGVGGNRSHVSSRHATPRALSEDRADDYDCGDDTQGHEEGEEPGKRSSRVTVGGASAAEPSRSPLPQRKRGRSPSAEVSTPVSLSPSVAPPESAMHAEEVNHNSRSSSSVPRRERTEVALAECSITVAHERNAKQEALQCLVVERALESLFHGLTKSQIAQLRWKAVRSRLEDALREATTVESDRCVDMHASMAEPRMEELIKFAKEQLRVWYDRAPA